MSLGFRNMNTTGNVIQVLGTVATLFGLGRSLWIVTKMWDKFRNAFRRHQNIAVGGAATTTVTAETPAAMIRTISIDQQPTVDAALRRLARGVEEVEAELQRHLVDFAAKVKTLESRLDGEPDMVDERIGAALASINVKNRKQLVRDLWIAVGGVVLTLLGQLLAFA